MQKSKRKLPTWAWVEIFAVALVVILVLLSIFSPVSGHLARRRAGSKGYQIPKTYSDTAYRWYYQNLSSREKEAYRLICAQLPDYPSRIAIPYLNEKSLEKVFTAVSYDNPEFFCLDYKFGYSHSGSGDYFIPEYVISRSTYEQRLKKLRSAADTFLRDAPVNGTDYEKELFVHDKLVEQDSYNDGDEDMIYTVYGALVNRSANCEGYSRSTAYLLKKLNVRSCVVTGIATRHDGKKSNHMWNIVWLNSKPYMLDTTFDDYQIGNDDGDRGDDTTASHVYFNITSSDIAKNHTLDQSVFTKQCTDASQYYLTKNGLYFKSYDQAREVLPDKITDALGRGERSIEMRFTNKDAFDEAKKNLLEGDDIYFMIDRANLRNLRHFGNWVSNRHISYITDGQFYVIRVYFQ